MVKGKDQREIGLPFLLGALKELPGGMDCFESSVSEEK
jgi:hypothetical protein